MKAFPQELRDAALALDKARAKCNALSWHPDTQDSEARAAFVIMERIAEDERVQARVRFDAEMALYLAASRVNG